MRGGLLKSAVKGNTNTSAEINSVRGILPERCVTGDDVRALLLGTKEGGRWREKVGLECDTSTCNNHQFMRQWAEKRG